MTAEEKELVEGAPAEEEQPAEEGGFFLESLTSLPQVEEEAVAPEVSYRSARAARPTPVVLSVDPNRALRELRERQQRLEKMIMMLTGVVLFLIVGGAVVFQTSFLEDATARFTAKGPVSNRPVNCESARDKYSEECLDKRAEKDSTWNGLARSPQGQMSNFSLHNHE